MSLRWFFPHLKTPIHQIVGSQCQIQGRLGFRGGLLIDGSVRGELEPAGDRPTVTVSASGSLEVETLEVDTLIVNGHVRARTIRARRVVLGASARLESDLSAGLLEMHTGAKLVGRVESQGDGRDGVSTPVAAGA